MGGVPLIACLAALNLVSAAEHPSFTGTWKMDAAKSDFGSLPAVGSIVDRIGQQEPELVINRARDGQNLIIAIPLDGDSKQNDILGLDMKTQGHWDGNTLAVDFTGRRMGREVSYHERWTMAPDGNSFKVARHLVSPRGETDQTLIFVKQ